MGHPVATVPMVMMFDVEPDDGQLSRPAPDRWMGFEATFDYARRLRLRLEERTGRRVRFNWMLRMDDQVAESHGDAAWAVHRYARLFAEAETAGDLVGLHPHAWRWRDKERRWVQDHADASWVEDVTARAFEAFETTFGARCRAHKFGSRFLSARLIAQVAHLGARAEMTVEPGARGAVSLDDPPDSTGYLPDQGTAPRTVYRSAADDPLRADPSDRRPANEGLWMLPCTAFDPAPMLPPWRRLARRVRFAGRVRHRPSELWAPYPADSFWRLVQRSIEPMERPYVSLSIRSDSLIRARSRDLVHAKLEHLVESADRGFPARIAFVRATDAIDVLTARP